MLRLLLNFGLIYPLAIISNHYERCRHFFTFGLTCPSPSYNAVNGSEDEDK